MYSSLKKYPQNHEVYDLVQNITTTNLHYTVGSIKKGLHFECFVQTRCYKTFRGMLQSFFLYICQTSKNRNLFTIQFIEKFVVIFYKLFENSLSSTLKNIIDIIDYITDKGNAFESNYYLANRELFMILVFKISDSFVEQKC